MRTWTKEQGPALEAYGRKMIKKPNPVYMSLQTEEFDVETNEGTLHANAGDYVAHDPISGHVWPVAASYVAQHYEDAK